MDAVTGADLERFRELVKVQAEKQEAADELWKRWGEANSESAQADKAVRSFVAELAERTS